MVCGGQTWLSMPIQLHIFSYYVILHLLYRIQTTWTFVSVSKLVSSVSTASVMSLVVGRLVRGKMTMQCPT